MFKRKKIPLCSKVVNVHFKLFMDNGDVFIKRNIPEKDHKKDLRERKWQEKEFKRNYAFHFVTNDVPCV